MAYNPFPLSYQPYYPTFQNNPVPAQQSQQAQNNSIIWVQGEAGAKSYFVAPNTTVQLWDSEAPIIYLKSADASGMPSFKVLEYTVKGDNKPIESINNNSNTFISKDEFKAVQGEIKALRSDVDKMKSAKTKKVVKVEEEDDE